MTNSKLLKDAIADAKAVRETAIANAKIALEEAFTPRLQSILSQKLEQEIAGDDVEDEDEVTNEEYGAEDAPTGDSSSIGAGKGGTESGTSGKQPSGKTTDSHTELGSDTKKETSAVGSELDDVTVVKEGEGEDEDGDGVIDDPTGASITDSVDDEEEDDVTKDDEIIEDDDTPEIEDEEEDEDELDLESIIKELESEISEDDDEEDEIEVDDITGDEPVADEPVADEPVADEPVADEPVTDEPVADEDEDDVDLDEILREMGYGEDDAVSENEDGDEDDKKPWDDEKEEELEEAYRVIRSLQGTINEVNLLNAKLLYSNKLFRSYELTNEQKMKVVETLDRTVNVREVKLVFATLAESLKIGVSTKRTKRAKITESFASRAVASTAPKKEILTETFKQAKRWQELANIKKK